MGQQISTHNQTHPQTDRSLSLYTQPSPRSSINTLTKTTKTITVNTLDELNLLKQMFNYRLKNKQYLTHCYGFQVINKDQNHYFQNFVCKSPFLSISVNFHFQKITDKFSDLYLIPIGQGSKLLAHCLKGFSLLYDQFGYFTPETRLINKQGEQWKVWISENMFGLKSKYQQKRRKNQISKQKFLQQIVHLFDGLRDEEIPQFSYSCFIYGKDTTNYMTPNLQLTQILCKLNQAFEIQKHNKNQRISLRRISVSSNQTVRKIQCNTLISFDDKTNDATMSKFKNTKQKNLNKSFSQYSSVKDPNKQSQKQYLSNEPSFQRKQSNKRFRNNSFSNHIGQSLGEYDSKQNNQFSNFRRVSSKLIQQTVFNDSKDNDCSGHLKNKSSASTPSNCTGWNKNMTPLNMFSTKFTGMSNTNFTKKQRSFTMDLSNKANNYQQQDIQQPRKITQNSELNSQSEENENKNKNFEQAFLPSEASIKQNQQVQELEPIQIVSKNPTSNTPSIAHKTRKCGKQTMKYLKQHLMNSSKSSHKRSLTDHVGINADPNKIKYCWSQQFDSQFFSMDSKNDNPFASKQIIKDEVDQNPHVQQVSNQDQSQYLQHQQKKIKRVKIADKDQLNEYSYRKDTDRICQNSHIKELSQCSKQASIARLPIFKSQGGFKSLLGNNKLSTLKSIKQIQVDVPIDEEILNDLNKTFTKHRFAKSIKLTH